MKKSNIITDHILKYTALILCLVLVSGLFSGCKKIIISEPLGKGTLVEVNDYKCSVKEGIFRLMEVADYYRNDADSTFWSRKIGDITMDEYVKNGVKDEMIRITAGMSMSDIKAVYISDEEQAALEQAAMDSFSLVSLYHDLSSYGITLSDVINLYTKQEFYSKLYDKISDTANTSVSEADTKVIEVNYAELPVNVSYNEVEELRSEIKNGTDFKKACEDAGYKPVMNQVLMKGQMGNDAFDDFAFSLVDGELSEIVDTTECIYLIQCVEDYMINESVANFNEKLASARQTEFDKYYAEFASDAVMRFNDSAWDEITVSGL